MKQFAHIGLILLMFFQLSYKSVVVLGWKLDQKRITEKYCVNKDKPMLHCNGQCYLAKQLRKLDREEQRERSQHSIPTEKLKQAESPLLSPSYPVFEIRAVHAAASRKFFTSSEEACRSPFGRSCFHPPDRWMPATA